MTTELETRLRDRLRELADYAPTDGVRIATVEPVRPSRGPLLAAVAAGIVLVVSGAIALTQLGGGPSIDTARTAEQPVPPIEHVLDVHASNFRFDRDIYVVPAGTTEIVLTSDNGSHTLAFDDPGMVRVHLSVPGGADRARVELDAGHDYRISCELPGHRRAGMEATIRAVDPETFGPSAG